LNKIQEAWTIGRQAINDYRLAKYLIPAGSIILMSQCVMHRNPLFFSDPELFYPDRWTKEAKSQLPRFSYFPFGGGIRGCVGDMMLAVTSIMVTPIITSLTKFSFFNISTQNDQTVSKYLHFE
jgi:cytochrome P450